MSREQNSSVEKLVFFERENLLQSRKMTIAYNLMPWLSVPFFMYILISTVLPYFNLLDYQNQLISLCAYFVLLLLATMIVLIKKNKTKDIEDSFPSGEEIETVFLFGLLVAMVYSFVLDYSNPQDIYKYFGAVTATLFFGFAISLKELFDAKNLREVVMCLIAPIIRICRVIHISILIGMTGLTVSIGYLYDYPQYILAQLVVIFGTLFATVALLSLVRKHANKCFVKKAELFLSGKQTLIFQLGPDYIVWKALKKIFSQKGIDVVNISEAASIGKQYERIVVLNFLRKKEEYLSKLSFLDAYLSSDGYVLDPFITDNYRRAFVNAWCGIPTRNLEPFTIKEYRDLFCRNKRKTKTKQYSPWRTVLFVTGLVAVLSPIVIYLVILLLKHIELVPKIGTADAWIAFAGSILGGSLTMLALVFTLHHERKNAEKAELQKIRPVLFCAINKEQFTMDGLEIRMPNCTNDYDFIRWRINNVSENVANHVRIVDERTFIKDQEELHEIDSDTLLDDYGISIMTVSMQDYIALEPHGVAQNRTNFSLETDEQGEYKINSAFDFLNAITIEYSDIKGIGVYRSKFTFHININIDNKNNPHVFIESVETTLLDE